MKDTANLPCRTLVDVLIGQGIRDAVISPGSRNTPLILALSVRDKIMKTIIPDERTAAFTALGMAIASNRPVMLACTSGTALYNYAPAVAEAFYRKVPLIVVSADRPERWIDQDDSQTLRQPGALNNIVKRSFNISATEGLPVRTKGCRFDNEQEWYVNRIANEAWITATTENPGPVHINIQLDNPLGTTIDYEERGQRIVKMEIPPYTVSPSFMRDMAISISGKKVLLVAGFMMPDHRLNRAIASFSKLPNVAICAEHLANLHLSPDELVSVIDLVLSQSDRETKHRLRPDIVISIGGSLVSRMLKDYIREYQPEELWTLSDTDPGVDCFQGITRHYGMDPGLFFRGLAGSSLHLLKRRLYSTSPDYKELWHNARSAALDKAGNITKDTPWSEYKAFQTICRSLPRDTNLFLSNGTAVRYAGLMPDLDVHACHCNRGVSGIEGGNATAAGIALRYPGNTLLISGDMSFGYYPQILGFDNLPDSFRIIVIDNKGGGIFRFIGTTRDLEQRDEYFCAYKDMPLRALCDAYGWQYLKASDSGELDAALRGFFKGGKKLLEIHTDPDISTDILRALIH